MIFLTNSTYVAKITGFDGSSITDMEYALASDLDTWYTFPSVALEAPSQFDIDNGYGWASLKFVGFNEDGTGNNMIFFTEAIGPGGVNLGESTDFRALYMTNDWSTVVNDTGLSTAGVALDLFQVGYEAGYALDVDASEYSGGLAGTANGTTFVQGAVAGMDRSYAQFNGTSGEILLDQSFGNIWGSDASFTMWFRTEATSGMMYMARESYSGSSKSYFSSDIKAGGTLEAFWRSKQGNESTAPAWAGTVINDGEWHMVAYVRDGSDLHVYIDGNLEGTLTNLAGSFLANVPVRIGSYSANSSNPSGWLNGDVDEMNMWSRALSATEVADLYAAQIHLNDGLIGQWSFDNGDATADVGADGTATNVTFASDSARSVAEFDGTAEISAGTGFQFTDEDFTYSMWIKPTSAVQNEYAIVLGAYNQAYTGYYLSQDAGNHNSYRFTGNDGSNWSGDNSRFSLDVDVWTHVTIVRSGTSITVYKNGSLEYSDSNEIAAVIGYAGANPELTLGNSWTNGSYDYGWQGKLDDVRVYNSALSAQEVAHLYTTATVADPMASSYMLFGYKPLFATAAEAEAASPDGSGYHVHNLDGSDHFMPNGLDMGDTQFHGTFGLEARYPMDTDMNDSVGSNNGTANGSVDFPNDSARDAMEILSDAAIATIPDTLNIGSGPYTVNVWIKPDNFDQAGTIITDHVTGSIYPSFHVSYNTSGQVNVYHRSANSSPHQVLTSTGSLTLNQWQLLTIAWDGSVMKIYFDGVLDSQGAVTNTTWTSTVDYRVGSDTYAGVYVRGMLDDLTIHNRAMPDSEVAYWHTTTTITPTLVGHWSFDSDATDSSSGYNGTVTAGSFESGDGRDFISFERESTGIVSLPDSLDSIVAGDYTMSAWVKLDTIQDTDFGYFGVMTIDGVGLSVTLGYPSVTSNGGDTTHHFSGVGLMSVDTWYHLVLVQEGSDKKLYLDGVLLGTNPTQPSNSWGIGTDNNIAKGYSSFDGGIDDVRIYSIALSAQEVADLHTATTVVPPGPTTDLTIFMADSYGDTWNGNSFTITDPDGNVVMTYTGPAQGVKLPNGVTETLTVEDGLTYTWSAGGGSYTNEVSFIVTDANGVELVNVGNLQASAGTGTFTVDVLSAPATIEAAVDSFQSDEITVSAVLNTVAQNSATAWAWSLSDDFVVGNPAGGTVVALGQTAAIPVTPGVNTIYVAAVDGSGNCIAIANVTQDTIVISIEINKYDSYGDGWNGAAFIMTDSNGTEVVNETLPSGGKPGPVTVTVQLPAGTYDYNLSAGSYPGEIFMTVVNTSSSETLLDIGTGDAKPATGQIVVAPSAPSLSVAVAGGYHAIYFQATANQEALDAGADKWAISATPFGDVGTTIDGSHVLIDLSAVGYVSSLTGDTVVGYAAVVNSSTGEILAKVQGSGQAMLNELPVGQEMAFFAVLLPTILDESDTLSGAPALPTTISDSDNLTPRHAGPFYVGDLEISSYGTILTDFVGDYDATPYGLKMPVNFLDGMGSTMSAEGLGRLVKDVIRKYDLHQLSGASAAYGAIFQSVLDGGDKEALRILDFEESFISMKLEGGGYVQSSRYNLTADYGSFAPDDAVVRAFDEASIPAEVVIIDNRTNELTTSSNPGQMKGIVAPAEMVISGQASVSSGEVTMTVEVGENAIAQGAVNWVYDLDQAVGDLGQVASGTSVVIGSSAVFTPAPAPYTAYVAAVDANGVIVATDSFVFDSTAVRLVKWKWYTTDWSGLNGGRMTLTDSLGTETISPVVSYDTNGAWHEGDIFELREDVYSWSVNNHSIRASDQGHLKLVEVDSEGNELREIIYVWALQTRMHKDGTSWPNQEFSGQFVIPEDIGDPVVSLIGDASMTVFTGDQFVDPGYSVSDAIDPSPSVSVTGHESLNISDPWIQHGVDPMPTVDGEALSFNNPNWFNHAAMKTTHIDANAGDFEVVIDFENMTDLGGGEWYWLNLMVQRSSGIGYTYVRLSNQGLGNVQAGWHDGDNYGPDNIASPGFFSSGALKVARVGDRMKTYYSTDGEVFVEVSDEDVNASGRSFASGESLRVVLFVKRASVDITGFNRTDMPYGAQEGDYTITYSAEDFSGNTHSVQRTVSVVPETYQWHHGNKIQGIVQYLFGNDSSGERSHMYLTNNGGNTKLYFTKVLQTWSAFSAYDHHDSGIEGLATNAAFGPSGKVLLGTSTGCVYLIQLDGDSVPVSYTKVHDNYGTPINRVHYAQTPNSWVIQYGDEIFTMPLEGGTPLSRMSIPSGAKVVDISAGDDAYCFVVRKADFTFTTYVVLPDWATIHSEEQMRAIFSVIGGTNIDYSYSLDRWAVADEDANIIYTDDIATWLLP